VDLLPLLATQISDDAIGSRCLGRLGVIAEFASFGTFK